MRAPLSAPLASARSTGWSEDPRVEPSTPTQMGCSREARACIVKGMAGALGRTAYTPLHI